MPTADDVVPGHNRCILIRHGQTEWSRARRHTGRTDLPLLPEGREQAAGLAGRLAAGGFAFSRVMTSCLRRAIETAEFAGLTAPSGPAGPGGAVMDPDLNEWDYGAYEGLTTAEVRRERPGWNLFDDGAPGGETAAEVGARVDRVIALIRAADGDVVCVAHAHVLRVFGARWLGLPATDARHLTLEPASISVVGWERDEPVIEVWNST